MNIVDINMKSISDLRDQTKHTLKFKTDCINVIILIKTL